MLTTELQLEVGIGEPVVCTFPNFRTVYDQEGNEVFLKGGRGAWLNLDAMKPIDMEKGFRKAKEYGHVLVVTNTYDDDDNDGEARRAGRAPKPTPTFSGTST